MHQSIPPAPSPPPPPPGYCGPFAGLVSPGVRHLQIFHCPGAGNLPTQGPLPFKHARGFPSECNYTEGFTGKKKRIGSSVKDRKKLNEGCKGMFSILCMLFFIAYQAKIITQRNWSYRKQVTRPELLWGKGVRDEVLQIWTAGHFSLHIGVTVRNLKGER